MLEWEAVGLNEWCVCVCLCVLYTLPEGRAVTMHEYTYIIYTCKHNYLKAVKHTLLSVISLTSN